MSTLPRYHQFFKILLTLKELNVIKLHVKYQIGDSINNNRTLTVNQVIRSLKYNNRTKVAKQLQTIYTFLIEDIKCDRSETTNRTDAIDINELVSTYRAIVMNDRRHRNTIGQLLSKVG